MGCHKLTYNQESDFRVIYSKKELTSNKSTLKAYSNYRYGFNGMEKDDEVKGTGNSYDFGARMYDSRLGRWLSMDPLTVQYSSLSSYNFVANNPLIYTDPNGEVIIIHYIDKDGNKASYTYKSGLKVPKNKYVKTTIKTLNKIQRKGGDRFGIIEHYTTSKKEIHIVKPENLEFITAIDVSDAYSGKPFEDYPATITWHPQSAIKARDGAINNAATALLHELAEIYYKEIDPDCHVEELRNLNKPVNFETNEEKKEADILWAAKISEYEEKQARTVGDYDTYGDKWIITEVEPTFNKAFKQQDRQSHKGKHVYSKGPFSRKTMTYDQFKEKNFADKYKDENIKTPTVTE